MGLGSGFHGYNSQCMTITLIVATLAVAGGAGRYSWEPKNGNSDKKVGALRYE